MLVHGETKEKCIDSVLTTVSEVTEATTEATEVKSFTPEIEVQETCDSESRILHNEIEYE